MTILTDYRGASGRGTLNTTTLCTMDVSRLIDSLETRGCQVRVVEAGSVDLTATAENPRFLLYTSSEGRVRGTYKRFLESRVFGLERLGYTPVPAFHFLLAHHDKVYMETLRSVLLRGESGQPFSRFLRFH